MYHSGHQYPLYCMTGKTHKYSKIDILSEKDCCYSLLFIYGTIFLNKYLMVNLEIEFTIGKEFNKIMSSICRTANNQHLLKKIIVAILIILV